MMLSFIKPKVVCQYFSKPNMEITTKKEITLFRIMLCATLLFLGETYEIVLFFYLFFFVSIYVGILLELHLFETEK